MKIDIVSVATEYESVKAQEKLITDRKKELANTIKQYAIENGQQDTKGSSYVKSGDFILGNVASPKITFNQEKALAYITEHRPDLVDSIMDTIQIVSEEKIENLVSKGELSVDDVAEMVDTKVSYRVNVVLEKPEEEEEVMPEVKTKPRVKKVLKKLKK